MKAACADSPGSEVARLEFTYPSQYEAIQTVRAQFRAFLEKLGVEPEGDVGFGLMLALTECVSNVIRHAHGQDGRPARVVFEATGRTLRLFIYDTTPHKPFPSTRSDDVPELEAESGRGLFLMQSLTDSITYRETLEPAGKVVVLEKKLPEPQVHVE